MRSTTIIVKNETPTIINLIFDSLFRIATDPVAGIGLKPMSQPKKPSVVEVIRYFRGTDFKTGYTHNLGGMSAICQLDYEKNKITVFPAFCREDENFDREVGLKLAKEAKAKKLGFIVPFDKSKTIHENIFEGVTNQIGATWLNMISMEKFKTAIKIVFPKAR